MTSKDMYDECRKVLSGDTTHYAELSTETLLELGYDFVQMMYVGIPLADLKLSCAEYCNKYELCDNMYGTED